MTARLSDILLKITLMALAFACATLLLRDSMAIGLRVPLDPNEGWNAYHALAAMTGAPLYPKGLMVNNYPPLSFYIVGALGRGLGDNIIAGRLVSLLSLLAIGMGLTVLLRQIGARVLDGIFAGLLLTAVILIASDYAAMDDPQLLGQALQIEALLLLFREKPSIALVSLLCVAGIFVKHNLVALPLAMFAWLMMENRPQARRLATYGMLFALAGLIAGWALLDNNLLAEIAAPRVWRLSNLVQAMTHYLSWAGLPLLVTAATGWYLRADPWMRFCLIYAGIALVLGVIFSAGDGVDANIFFDLDIALALVAGLMLKLAPYKWAGLLSLAYAAPLGLFLARTLNDNNFAYTEAFQKQAPLDIAFLEVNTGPALCENLSLCYWAGKDASVDVFNIAEGIKTGKRRDDEIVHLFETGSFHVVQLDSWTPFALGQRARAALAAHYRIDHVDDNGVFLVSR